MPGKVAHKGNRAIPEIREDGENAPAQAAETAGEPDVKVCTLSSVTEDERQLL